MARSRGEPPPTLIDKYYPFQVALHASEVKMRFDNVEFLARLLGRYRLNRNVHVHPDVYIVYMFGDQHDAECFQKAFDGEWITPEQSRRKKWTPRYTWMPVERRG
ncbi:hypothetical protein [Phyllobacterium sp. YR531]|uniref:hypothetical protein n=1 Tax=Phyllobacterium sp. YR531 TaxID=1144343 RepID=UPI00026FA9CE|nr:hypothetical protein [Phyllobacterium sp. YR531]EJN04180.1 hypothetical protein PMI41_01819 [Phyllobacterium sp. YR531]